VVGIAFSTGIHELEESEIFWSSISPSSLPLADFFLNYDPYGVGNFPENQAANTAPEPEERHVRL
jgi:hypothetical protein